MRWKLVVLGLAFAVGCDSGGKTSPAQEGEPEAAAEPAPTPEAPPAEPEPSVAEPEAPAPDCVPSAAEWQAGLGEHVKTLCGDCHGETLQFGASATLTGYDGLIAGKEGERLVDLLAQRLGNGTMPPAAQPQPTAEVRKALIQWATCDTTGEIIEPNPGGIGSNRPILDDSAGPPAGTDFFDLRAPDFEVQQDWSNRYECFTFEAPTDAPRYIRRIETLIGDARVLHHTVLIPGGGRAPGEHGPCNADNPLNLIYGWAPGQGALHFDEGGMLLRPGQKLTLQVHYNNAAGHPDVKDASGVRIYHGPVEGPEINMLALGPIDFQVPANQMAEATGYCRLPQDTRIIASFPHMHEIGASFEQVVLRGGPDGPAEPIISLDGWSFDAQYIYETPVALAAGDVVRTTCRFRNETDRMVRSGANTEDEMCFNFAYVSPPLPNNYCNSGAPAEAVPLYEPGVCAPDGADEVSVPQVSARLVIGAPEAPTGGELRDGTWVLSAGRLFLPATNLGPITIDADATTIVGQGLLAIDGDGLIIDSQIAVHLVTSVTDFDQLIGISVGADWALDGADPTSIALSPTCGDSNLIESVRFSTDGGSLTFQLAVDLGPAVLTVELDFDPVE